MYNNKTNKYEGYIYKITNKVNGKIYIGQTRQTLRKRFRQHVEHSLPHVDDGYMVLPKAIAKYGAENFEISELYKTEANSVDELSKILDELEIKFIKEYKSLVTENGYNITVGGNSPTEHSMTPVDKYSIDGTFINSYESAIEGCRQTYIPEDGYANVLACCAGKKRTAYNFVWRYKGEPYNKYRVYKIPREKIPIDVYDIGGNYIRSFDDIYDPIGVLDNIYKKQQIRQCCRGELTCYNKYVFRYKGDPFDKYAVLGRSKNKPLYCYDIDDNFIQRFENSTIAAEYVANQKDIKIITIRKGITQCAKGNDKKSAYGYKWYYEYNQPDKSKIQLA